MSSILANVVSVDICTVKAVFKCTQPGDKEPWKEALQTTKGGPKNLSLKIRSSLLGHLLSMQRGVTRNGNGNLKTKDGHLNTGGVSFQKAMYMWDSMEGGITTFAARALSVIGFSSVIPMGWEDDSTWRRGRMSGLSIHT